MYRRSGITLFRPAIAIREKQHIKLIKENLNKLMLYYESKDLFRTCLRECLTHACRQKFSSYRYLIKTI